MFILGGDSEPFDQMEAFKKDAAPALAELLSQCKAHGIPMLAMFMVGHDGHEQEGERPTIGREKHITTYYNTVDKRHSSTMSQMMGTANQQTIGDTEAVSEDA